MFRHAEAPRRLSHECREGMERLAARTMRSVAMLARRTLRCSTSSMTPHIVTKHSIAVRDRKTDGHGRPPVQSGSAFPMIALDGSTPKYRPSSESADRQFMRKTSPAATSVTALPDGQRPAAAVSCARFAYRALVDRDGRALPGRRSVREAPIPASASECRAADRGGFRGMLRAAQVARPRRARWQRVGRLAATDRVRWARFPKRSICNAARALAAIVHATSAVAASVVSRIATRPVILRSSADAARPDGASACRTAAPR